MKTQSTKFRKLFNLALFAAVLLAVSDVTLAQTEIPDILGDYEVFTTSESAKHDGARIIIMHTERGPGADDEDSFGLAFVSNRAAAGKPRGDGIVCDDAVLILDDSAISCTKMVKNPAGRLLFEETLTVGVTGSFYCEALKQSLVDEGHDDKIVDTSDGNCDDADEQCICYDIDHRGNASFGPPTQGSGSGRGGG